MDLFTVIVAILGLIVFYWYWTVPKNLPPGSAGFPIVGHLPFLSLQTHETFLKFKNKYGNFYYLYLGNQLALILNDFESIKQCFLKQGDVFSGRCPIIDLEEVNGEYSGIVMTDGEYWKQHRRFILRNLRDYGVGKLALEPLILNEIQHFINEIKSLDNKENIELKSYLSASLTNNIHILVQGKRYDYNHKTITDMLQTFRNFDEHSQLFPVDAFFPVLKPIVRILDSRRIAKIGEFKAGFIKIIEEIVADTKKRVTNDENENYIQAYLNERKIRLKTNENEDIFTEYGLLHNTRDLIGAGTDTAATLLAWATLYMAKYPEIQKKVQDEIERVIGQREPSYNDRNNTPYTESTLCEIQRMVSLAPLSIPHRVMKDTTLYGYNIPKDTVAYPNIWAVHYDEKLWGDPQNFRPERFIGPNGDCVKPEYLIPFSIGKRACVGEPLARMELYLYFVSLLQHFTFLPPEGEEITFKSTPGFTRQPKSKFITVKSKI